MSFGEKLFLYSIVAICSIVFFSGIYALVTQANSPTFQLVKNEWTCTVEHFERHGKHNIVVCDVYERVK
jgi:hypothetical protein